MGSAEGAAMIRREFLAGLAALAASPMAHGQTLPTTPLAPAGTMTVFGPRTVPGLARALSVKDYVPRPDIPREWLDISYDDFSHIWFADRNALWNNTDAALRVDAFAAGLYAKQAVQISIVEGGHSQTLPFNLGVFDKTDQFPDMPVDETMGYSGFRLRGELNTPDIFTEFFVMKGASYFRGIGTGQIYGLSARGLAIDTAEPTGEEFPDFIAYWIERPGPRQRHFVVHALMDSPSLAGAYKFTLRPGPTLEVDVEAQLFPRRDLQHVGIAPLTSMFLFDETNRNRFDDFRPAVHDNDGLLMVNGAGEVLWRPLANPVELQISSFHDTDPKGFGLMQRARNFDDFADIVAQYHRRPSLWVEPGEGWGEGAVTLIELPTDTEVNDNIVAYWRPAQPMTAGAAHRMTYRLHWGHEPEVPGNLAKVTNMRLGAALQHGRIATVDFERTPAMPADFADLTATVSNSHGTFLSAPHVEINPQTGGPRLALSFDPGDASYIEFRGQLSTAHGPYSETWLYRWTA
ncbi:MAG: glucan biosynthesis protein G [Albidovulum sp.]